MDNGNQVDIGIGSIVLARIGTVQYDLLNSGSKDASISSGYSFRDGCE